MTPDGIATEDWDRVLALAVQVVNDSAAGNEEDSDAASMRLREVLDELQEKYGALPSLLATRADYVASPEEREYWLLAAYEQAQKRDDPKNLVWVSSSLACFHLEEAPDVTKGAVAGFLGATPTSVH
jgi:NADH:ubiquinone oxidoreductase subunit E